MQSVRRNLMRFKEICIPSVQYLIKDNRIIELLESDGVVSNFRCLSSQRARNWVISRDLNSSRGQFRRITIKSKRWLISSGWWDGVTFRYFTKNPITESRCVFILFYLTIRCKQPIKYKIACVYDIKMTAVVFIMKMIACYLKFRLLTFCSNRLAKQIIKQLNIGALYLINNSLLVLHLCNILRLIFSRCYRTWLALRCVVSKVNIK